MTITLSQEHNNEPVAEHGGINHARVYPNMKTRIPYGYIYGVLLGLSVMLLALLATYETLSSSAGATVF